MPVCAWGHGNPPHVETCTTCGAPMDAASGTTPPPIGLGVPTLNRAPLIVGTVLAVLSLLAWLALASSPSDRYFLRDPGLLDGGVTLLIRCPPPIAPGRAPMELDDNGHAYPLNTLTGVSQSEQDDIASHCHTATTGRLIIGVLLLFVAGAGWFLTVRHLLRRRTARRVGPDPEIWTVR